MLIITRKVGESLIISDNIEVTIVEASKDRIKIGIAAPKDVVIVRKELIDTQNANKDSSMAVSKGALEALLRTLPKP